PRRNRRRSARRLARRSRARSTDSGCWPMTVGQRLLANKRWPTSVGQQPLTFSGSSASRVSRALAQDHLAGPLPIARNERPSAPRDDLVLARFAARGRRFGRHLAPLGGAAHRDRPDDLLDGLRLAHPPTVAR